MADAKSYFISGPILTITNDQNHVTIKILYLLYINLSISRSRTVFYNILAKMRKLQKEIS